jgi:hypothetical protein
MSKDKSKPKKPTPPQRSEPPSPMHSASEAVMAVYHRDNTAMTADSDAEISDRMARRDSGASHPNKAHRHPATGQYVEGVPGQPTIHDVLAVDANDSTQTDAMRRSAAPSAPNGPPVGPNDTPATRVLDSGNLEDLTR